MALGGSPSVIPALSRDPAAVGRHGERTIRGHWTSRSPAPQTRRYWIPVTDPRIKSGDRNDGRRESPEGDHFPRTPMMRTYVVPSPPAPAPPSQDACWCIRGRNGGSVGTGLGGGDEEGTEYFWEMCWGAGGAGVSRSLSQP